MSIQFIQDPPFVVDFRQFAHKEATKLSSSQKVLRTIAKPFELTQFIFIAFAKSAYTTVQYSWTSFKLIVLNCPGSLWDAKIPNSAAATAFRVFFWIAAVFWCFIMTTCRLLIAQLSPPSSIFLTELAGDEIDIEHLQTKELAIDVSGVPKEITIDTLTTLFDEINFSHPSRPGYMAPTSRQEGNITYTQIELEESLATYISKVKGRIAFLGTPPAYDTPRLMAFYQQIEDAVRFSIHKVSDDLQKFQKTNGMDPSKYQGAQLRQYKGLLEDKARIAIDMAIAGKHCGARYMGEAMSTYFSLKGETSEDGTLQDSLIELLAHKRKEIAQAQVQTHLGSDTHALSKYMGNLGQPLGLPGTRNVIEHLDQNFEPNKFLRLFFAEYTVDVIIDTVQAKIKKSQLFREKIIDWLKDQVKEWKKDAGNVQEIMKQIQFIMDEKVENVAPSPDFQKFQELITHLKTEKVAWPAEENWADFVDELFALVESKKWFKAKFHLATSAAMPREKQKIKTACSEETLGKEAASQLKEAILKDGPLPVATLGEKEIEKQKIEKIRKILPIQKETLERVLEGKVTLEAAIKDHYDLTRREEFFSALQLDNFDKQGVSPAIMEWLLVSQKILLPQEGS